jgi:uncharacterized protein (TIGR03435 family)
VQRPGNAWTSPDNPVHAASAASEVSTFPLIWSGGVGDLVTRLPCVARHRQDTILPYAASAALLDSVVVQADSATLATKTRVRGRRVAGARRLTTGRVASWNIYYVTRSILRKGNTLALVAITVLVTTVLLNESSRAQSPPAAHTEFEVASIKPNNSGSNNMGAMAQPGGRFGAQNVPLRFLISTAYSVKDFQIAAEGSSWINTDRYDITAKAPEGIANGFEPMRPMLQSLLADRFKLVLHRETKELPTYDLVAAKGGLKVSIPKDSSCVTPDPKNPRPREQMPFCDRIRTGRGLIEAYGITMPRLLAALSDVLGRVVVDKTGFSGIFDGRLEFSPDEAITDATAGSRAGQPAPTADLGIPSIFTALQEQLGLKVESTKGPVEVLVVDHVEKPIRQPDQVEIRVSYSPERTSVFARPQTDSTSGSPPFSSAGLARHPGR